MRHVHRIFHLNSYVPGIVIYIEKFFFLLSTIFYYYYYYYLNYLSINLENICIHTFKNILENFIFFCQLCLLLLFLSFSCLYTHTLNLIVTHHTINTHTHLTKKIHSWKKKHRNSQKVHTWKWKKIKIRKM